MRLKFAARIAYVMGVVLSAVTAAPAFGNGVHALSTFTNDKDSWVVQFQSYPPDLGDHRVDVGGSHGMVFQYVWLDFGVEFRNERNGDSLGDYTRLGAPLRFSFDERNASMDFLAMPSTRNYHLQFVRRLSSSQYIDVSYALDYVAPEDDRVTHHVLFNPTSMAIPPGWTGFDHMGSTALPPGYTFADVMRDVDMVRITTFTPGMAYPDSWFAVMFDNLTLQSVAVHQ
jgi:hypothetical protein